MSTQTADTATASTTATETATETPTIPGREEVLKHFAQVAMQEAAVPPPNEGKADIDTTDNALSQSTDETAGAGATEGAGETPALLEPEPEVENHLEGEQLELSPETQDRINRRIGKEVAKSKALETEVADLRAKLAEKPAATPTGPVPLAEIHDPRKLAEEKTRAEEAFEQADSLLERIQDEPEAVEAALRAARIELKDADGNESYDELTMRKFLRSVRTNADKMVRKTIPARETFLASAEKHAAEAFEYMPELKDASSDRSKLFRQVIAETPGLQSRTDWPMRAALGVEVLEKFNARLARTLAPPTAPAPKPKRELPVTIPAPRTQAPAAPKVKDTFDASAMADDLLKGKKSTRLDYIKALNK
jgi:hypothetical protein